MSQEFDVLIIGSGAGGGTVADRLAPLVKEGARIAILESGPHYTRDYFTQREIEMMGLLWNNGAWPTKDGAITFAAGRGVGGSTMIYTGVTFRLPDHVCDEWDVDGINAADLKPRFERLEKDVNAINPAEDMINDNNRLFKEGCEKLGYEVVPLQLNLKGCQQNGFCNIGCISGGKQGTLEVQIPRATAAGVELIPNCHVNRVENGTVYVEVHNPPAGTLPGLLEAGRYELKAKRVVLAAGSPGSPAVLLRSGLQAELPTLGAYFAMHPALTVYGIQPEKIKNYRGFPKTYFTPAFSNSHHYYLETAFYYPFITTKHLGLWGQELKDVMRAYDRLMCMIVLNHDQTLPTNKIELDKQGRPVLDYTLSEESITSLVHAQISATRILFAAGCEKAIMPCADKVVFSPDDVEDAKLEQFIRRENFLPNKIPVASAHPQGGCRMGKDKTDSVTDRWGQVHGHEWLYVADGSLFPKSAHVNPYLTIMALADRVADRLIDTQGAW